MIQKYFYCLLALFLGISQVQAGEACRNLKPVHELKDLLQQLHTNLDSNCILEMTDGELEETWQLPIIEMVRGKRSFLEVKEAMSKPYSGGESNFVVFRQPQTETSGTSLLIASTFAYRKEKKSLFPDGRLPNYLSNPIIEYPPSDYLDYYPHTNNSSNFLGENQHNDFFKVINVHWENPHAKQNKLPRMKLIINSDATVDLIEYVHKNADN